MKRDGGEKKADSVCRACGQTIPGGGKRTLCDECRRAQARKREAARHAKRREEWLATAQRCESCGREFTAPGRCRFCPDCRGAERALARRRATKRASWVVGRARRGQDNRPDPAIAGSGPAGGRAKKTEQGAVRREDGVLVLPPCAIRKAQRKPPRPPKKGTRRGSMADVQYRLDKENYERWLRGERPVSYGYFVAYLEGRMPLKK